MPPLRPHLLSIACLLGLMWVAPLRAQVSPDYAPASGDPMVDRYLADINEYASRYPAAFADEMGRYYMVPRAYVEAMQEQPDWAPGDIYMACALAQVAGQPCRAVVREWSRDHAGGWEAVAERLQVPPGTPQFRRLRKSLDDTYRRWERPAPSP